MRGPLKSSIFLLLSVATLGSPAGPASALGDPAPITVTTPTDGLISDEDCSLREAITAANTNTMVDTCRAGIAAVDVIQVPAGVYQLTVGSTGENAAAGGDLDITSATRIEGAGAGQTFVQAGNLGGVDSNGIDRVFHIPGETDNPYVVTFEDLTIRNGKPGVGQPGGGLYRGTFGPVDLTRVVISGNVAGGEGGGLNVNGLVTLTDSSINFNMATGAGGGMRVPSGVTLSGTSVVGNRTGVSGGGLAVTRVTATNSTISGNSAPVNGGGIFLPNTSAVSTLQNVTVGGNRADIDDAGGGTGGGIYAAGDGGVPTSKHMVNTVLADNTTGDSSPAPQQCAGPWTSGGGNVIENLDGCTFTSVPEDNVAGTDVSLYPVGDYGGLTATQPSTTGSVVFDAGVSTGCPATDQRGVVRPADASDDDTVPECDSGAVEFPALTVKGPADPIPEGDSGTTPATFKVKLSSPAVVETTFSYEAIGDGGVNPGDDYEVTEGENGFTIGQQVKTIQVPIIGDTEEDANPEIVRLVVSATDFAEISKDRAGAKIRDDDPYPHPRFVDIQLKRHLRAEGEVHVLNPVPECFAQVPVRVQRKTPDGWTKGVKVLTNNNGLYEAELEDKTGKYRSRIAKFVVPGPGGGTLCGKDTSDEETHSHN